MPTVIVTQHTAGVTHESRANITRIAALAFADAAKGKLPPRIINPAVVPRFAERYAAEAGAADRRNRDGLRRQRRKARITRRRQSRWRESVDAWTPESDLKTMSYSGAALTSERKPL